MVITTNGSSGTTTAKTSYVYNDPNDHTLLTSKTDPDGKVTTYTCDGSGNLTSAVYDSAGANQTTSYSYDKSNRLAGVTKPDGTQITFGYDANGQRTSVKVTPPSGGSASVVNDYSQLGHLAYQTDGNGTLLASYTYDSSGAPVSVQVGSDPSSAPRYYYVYNTHGDVVSLVDTSGASVASYSYDSWGNLTTSSETFPGGANGWTNPYRYDGHDGARYDASDGLSWLSVRAYDPSSGRFLSRDPLGRAPLFLSDNSYVYAGNNPITNVDPSGQKVMGASNAQVKQAAVMNARGMRLHSKKGNAPKCDTLCHDATRAQNDAVTAENGFKDGLDQLGQLAIVQGFFAYPIARLTKQALEELSEKVVFQVLAGGIAAVAGELLMGYLLFQWEASQSLSWFRQKGNVDAFFTWAPGLVVAISAAAGLAALAGTADYPGFGAFAVGVLLGGEGVISKLSVAHEEQDREYR